jgi:hypothetical protein
MTATFEFPEVTIGHDRMQMFRTSAPAPPGPGAAAEAARRFGVEGKPEDHGTTMVVRDRAAVVEVFVPSDSLRFTRWPGRDCEVDGRPSLPDDEAAVAAATKLLAELGLHDDEPRLRSVSRMELARARRGDGDVEVIPVAVHVNFGFALDGLPVLGPGAKLQATLTSERDLLECYRFWRRPEEAGAREIIGLDEAIARLRADATYAPLGDDARVTFHDVRLGYLALPPARGPGLPHPGLRVPRHGVDAGARSLRPHALRGRRRHPCGGGQAPAGRTPRSAAGAVTHDLP